MKNTKYEEKDAKSLVFNFRINQVLVFLVMCFKQRVLSPFSTNTTDPFHLKLFEFRIKLLPRMLGIQSIEKDTRDGHQSHEQVNKEKKRGH